MADIFKIEYLVIFIVASIVISYIIVEILFPLSLIIEAVLKGDYYLPYDVLSPNYLTGLIRRQYCKKYQTQIYKQAVERKFEWLKITENELEQFFISNEILYLTDKLITLEMCSRILGYEYDGELILYKPESFVTRANKLISLNESSLQTQSESNN